MAERPMYNEDDDLFNYQPLCWLRQHQGRAEDPLTNTTVIRHNENVIILQGCGVSVDLHANGTWTLEDTTGG